MKYFVNLKHPDKLRYAIKGPHGYFAKVGPINQSERSLKICGWKLKTLTEDEVQKLKRRVKKTDVSLAYQKNV